jgi:hypothetical protein
LEILLEPGGDGHGESGFFAVKNLCRKILFECLTEDEFGLATSHFVIGSKREGVGDEIGIEEGNPDFEGVCHAGAIDLHQDTFLKIQFRAKIEDSFQTSREATAVGEAGDVFKSVVTVELVAGIGGEKIVALAIAAGSHPKEKTDFCGEAEPFQELSHKKRKALVVVGDREALDEVIDGDPDADGKEREALHEKVGLKAGISCKKFIPSVSAKDGFYFSSCETGEEPCWNEGGVAERLIQTSVDGGQGLGNIFWGEGLVMVFGANFTGDHFGKGEFIVGGFLKADREGVQLFLG